MATRQRLLRLLDRLTSFIPGPPSMRPDPTLVPDPDDARESIETRVARRRLWSRRYRKDGRGGYR